MLTQLILWCHPRCTELTTLCLDMDVMTEFHQMSDNQCLKRMPLLHQLHHMSQVGTYKPQCGFQGQPIVSLICQDSIHIEPVKETQIYSR